MTRHPAPGLVGLTEGCLCLICHREHVVRRRYDWELLFDFLGLPWQSRRGSSFIWGVWHDARHVADQIAIQASYAAYDDAARRRAPAVAQVG